MVVLVVNKRLKGTITKNLIFKPPIYSKNSSVKEIPNLKGKSLKEALEISNSIGIKLDPNSLSGKIVWQSLKPGSEIIEQEICKVRLSI